MVELSKVTYEPTYDVYPVQDENNIPCEYGRHNEEVNIDMEDKGNTIRIFDSGGKGGSVGSFEREDPQATNSSNYTSYNDNTEGDEGGFFGFTGNYPIFAGISTITISPKLDENNLPLPLFLSGKFFIDNSDGTQILEFYDTDDNKIMALDTLSGWNTTNYGEKIQQRRAFFNGANIASYVSYKGFKIKLTNTNTISNTSRAGFDFYVSHNPFRTTTNWPLDDDGSNDISFNKIYYLISTNAKQIFTLFESDVISGDKIHYTIVLKQDKDGIVENLSTKFPDFYEEYIGNDEKVLFICNRSIPTKTLSDDAQGPEEPIDTSQNKLIFKLAELKEPINILPRFQEITISNVTNKQQQISANNFVYIDNTKTYDSNDLTTINNEFTIDNNDQFKNRRVLITLKDDNVLPLDYIYSFEGKDSSTYNISGYQGDDNYSVLFKFSKNVNGATLMTQSPYDDVPNRIPDITLAQQSGIKLENSDIDIWKNVDNTETNLFDIKETESQIVIIDPSGQQYEWAQTVFSNYVDPDDSNNNNKYKYYINQNRDKAIMVFNGENKFNRYDIEKEDDGSMKINDDTGLGTWILVKENLLSLIHISEPTRRSDISYAVF